MIGSGVSTDSMMAASFGIIDFIISTTSTTLITSTTSSLSATSASHGGGVGAGVLRGVGARATRTDTTAPTTVPVMDTAIAVGLEWLNYRGGSLARAITMALSTESWDLRLGEQFGPTSATADM